MGQQDHLHGAIVTAGRAGAALRGLVSATRRWYGAHPLHLLALLAAFALAGYAVRAVAAAGQWRGFALWFAVAIVGHDLLLFPLYSLADVSLRRLLPARGRPSRRTPAGSPLAGSPLAGSPLAGSPLAGSPLAGSPLAGPPVINYVRVPAGFSLLLLLVWFPLILGLSAGTYHRASGLSTGPYLWRWLGVTGVLFAAAAVAYALRLRRAAGRRPRTRGRLAS
jgi:hypothetical protein